MAYYEIAGQFLGGDHNFHRAGIEANWQTDLLSFPSHHKWVFGVRGELGWQRPLRREEIPIYERFFAGGSTSVRGYDRHGIGPLDANGNPLGGLTWAEASAELRFPIWRSVGGVIFFDTGQIRPRPHDWSSHDIFAAYGAGARLATPVGPSRFDVGIPLRNGAFIENFEIYFSVGHAF